MVSKQEQKQSRKIRKKRRYRPNWDAVTARVKYLRQHIAEHIRCPQIDAIGSLPYLQEELRKAEAACGTTLQSAVAKAVARVEKLKSYSRGELTEELGVKATTPCIVVADAMHRRALHKAAKISLGLRPKGAHMCHRCDTPHCVRPDHMFWGTRRDNVRDCILKGRFKGGRTYESMLAAAEKRLAALLARMGTHQ